MTARWTNHHEILREFIRASFGAGLAAVVTMPAAAQGPIDFKGPGAPYEEISWEYVGGRGVPPMHLVNADGHAIAIIGDPRVAGSTGSQIVDQQGPLWFTWVTDGTLNGYLELRVRIANTNQAPGTNAQVAARGVAVAADAGVGAAVTEGAPPSAQPRRAPPAPPAPGTGLRFRKVLEPRLQRAVRAELEFTSEMQSQDNVVLMWKMTGPWSSEGLVNLLTELGAQVQVQSMAGTTLVKVSDWTIDGTLTEGDVVAASGQLVFSLKVMR